MACREFILSKLIGLYREIKGRTPNKPKGQHKGLSGIFLTGCAQLADPQVPLI